MVWQMLYLRNHEAVPNESMSYGKETVKNCILLKTIWYKGKENSRCRILFFVLKNLDFIEKKRKIWQNRFIIIKGCVIIK